jgi:tRNA(fMet)-specific endonuclease VapC
MRLPLLDTDVFSFLFKRDTRAALYAPYLAHVQACMSFQSVAELRFWALVKRWGEPRRRSLDAAIARTVLLPCDDELCRHWAAVTAHRRRAGRPVECGDAWIAATALRHGIPLLTHNARDYADIPGLTIISHGQ